MDFLCLILVAAFPAVTTFRHQTHHRKERKCEEVTAAICLKEVHTGYNSTYFPNHLSHRSQIEAIMELNTFSPLIRYGCSKHLATFLCSLYIPYCYPGFLVLPCRALCLHAMHGCKPIMERYNFNWNFNCSKYPDSSESNMCLGNDIKGSEIKGTKKEKNLPEGKEKIRARKGWVYGRENDTLHLSCPEGKLINIRKVRPSINSGCCPNASKEVVSAICTANVACSLLVSKNTLGAHCKNQVTKLSIRYRCVHNHQIKKPPCSSD